jgi:hypothetical protein
MKTSMKFRAKPRSASGLLIAITLFCFALSPRARAGNQPLTPDPGGTLPFSNTADGANALAGIASGAIYNAAFGTFSLLSNGTASFNTGVGGATLLLNTADANTAAGAAALLSNTTGSGNTANGAFALFNNTSGSENIALGDSAGLNQDTGSNDIYIGDTGFSGESNVIAIGNAPSSGTAYDSFYVGGVFGATVDTTTATAVFVDAGGKLGTVLVGANGNMRNKATVPTAQGAQPQAMLNEVHKEQKRIAELEDTVARLAATVKEQAAQIQKVSAQLELKKPAPRTVANR